MADPTDAASAGSPQAMAAPMDTNTRLSYERTTLSHERTLMSWLRTANSLITFGFTIYKFFDIEQARLLPHGTQRIMSARTFAVFMIAAGLFSLVAAAIENWQYRRRLRKQGMEVPLSLATLLAVVLGTLGLLALASAVFRW